MAKQLIFKEDHIDSGTKVFFSCHSDDFKYYSEIKNDILSIQNTNFFYLEDNSIYPDDKDTYNSYLDDFNLIIFPVSMKFLTEPCRSYDIDFKYAIEKHLPILPIIVEPGLFEVFNIKCNGIQALDKTSNDSTQESYKDKLKKYLNSFLLSDGQINKIKEAFDAYIFLSYRKKDRMHAQSVMNEIHSNEFMRDVAIWYDENLTPGENYNDEIEAILHKSDLFSLVVTPNINEKDNYVIMNEYPDALKNNKPILPIESEETDKDELKFNFQNIPETINIKDKNLLAKRLKELLFKEGIKENDNPEHLFYIGLAYYNAIDVEKNIEKGLDLITKSANNNFLPAMKELSNIYFNGKCITANLTESLKWQEKYCESIYDVDQLYNEVVLLATLYLKNNKYIDAINACERFILYKKGILDKYDLKNSLSELIKDPTAWNKNNNVIDIVEENDIINDGELFGALGIYYSYAGKKKNAVQLGEKMYNVYSDYCNNNNIPLVWPLITRAYFLIKVNGTKQAVKYAELAYNTQLKCFGQDNPDTFDIIDELVFFYIMDKQYEKALDLCIKGYSFCLKQYSMLSEKTLAFHRYLYKIYEGLNKKNIAVMICERCLSYEIELYSKGHPNVLDVQWDLSLLYMSVNRPEESNKLVNECYESQKEMYGLDNKNTKIRRIYKGIVSLGNKITDFDNKLDKLSEDLDSINKRMYHSKKYLIFVIIVIVIIILELLFGVVVLNLSISDIFGRVFDIIGNIFS